MERPGRMKLDLEVAVEDVSDEVYSFQIQRSLIYLKFVGIVKKYHHTIRIPLKEGLF